MLLEEFKIKRFDPLAITQRMINNLQSKDNWSKLQKDGATYQYIEAMAEAPAEIARYGEYLLGELKWDTSRNYSSTKHMGRLVGKKLERKHSAVGTITVSHSDLEGVPRYSYLGVDNFSIDSESNYDNQEKDTSLEDTGYIHALVPWVDTNTYTVPQGAIFNTKDGIPFIAAIQKTIDTFTTTWSLINQSTSSLKTFKADAGWEGYKYITVPIVQGIQREVILGSSDGTASQTFLVASLDIEAADSYYTKQFCYITVQLTDGTVQKWTEVQHLTTVSATEKVFEINILDDLSGTEIKFGDSVFGAIPSSQAIITLHYLETKGSEGNVTTLYNFKNEINGVQLPETTKYRGLTIGCQNMWFITGGKDLETLAEFKTNAETAYSKNYEILHTYTELEERINTISPIPLVKVQTSSYTEDAVVNSTHVFTNKLGITGLSTSLEPLTSLEQTIFTTVLNNVINENVLSNKQIKYLTPNIVEIDSAVELDLKTPISSTDAFKTDLESYLQKQLGKTRIDSIDRYMQSDLLSICLNYSSNIGAILTTNLFTIRTTDITYGYLTNSDSGYIAFNFELPKLNMNVLSREGYCDKGLADGNEVYCVFNLQILNNKYTFVVQETSSDTSNNLYYELDDYFEDSNFTTIFSNDSGNKFVLKQLLKEKHTFNTSELKNISKLTTKDEMDLDVYFYIQRNETQPTFTFLVNAENVAECLEFIDPANTSIDKIYTRLSSSLDTGMSSCTVSIEPVDKTVTSDWNTIMYYKNIDVSIDS